MAKITHGVGPTNVVPGASGDVTDVEEVPSSLAPDGMTSSGSSSLSGSRPTPSGPNSLSPAPSVGSRSGSGVRSGSSTAPTTVGRRSKGVA